MADCILGIDIDEAADRFRARARDGVAGASPSPIAGVPGHETTRSPAAAVVADAAAARGLFLFHFEHRAPLELPEAWVLPGREADAEAPEWVDGVRAESKYQSFRHDQALGSFHPHHRAKWSTHELLHGLVGCAWKAGASPFFHATAGRLAELLPVALWYFFDEACLARCVRHAGDGALFRTHCPACEAPRAPDPEADPRRWIRDGLRFVEAELTAVARSRRAGDVIPHRWATIDLSSDGVAYARAHGARLASPEMEIHAARFGAPGFVAAGLDALEDRVLEVLRGLLGEGIPTAATEPDVWIRQDLGWRLLSVGAETEGEAAEGLMGLVDALADGAPGSDVAAGYSALHADWELPAPDDVFAVGYDVPGVPPTSRAFVDGLRTGLPRIDWLLGDALDDLGDRFAPLDLARPERRALALRFADFLRRERPELGDAAAFEATVTSLPRAATAPLPQRSADGRVRCAPGVRAVRFEIDAAEALDALERGASPPPAGVPTAFLVGRDGGGEPVIVDIDPEWPAALRSEGGLLLDEETEEALMALGLVEPIVRRE